MTKLILGVDVGTSAIKAALFDSEGTEVGSHSEEYSLLTPRAGHVELEPATYLSTFATAVRGVLERSGTSADDLLALGLSAQGETLLTLDDSHQPVGRAIVWMDNRASAEADEIEAHFGRSVIQQTTGQVAMDAIWPAAKILWIKRNDPSRFAQTSKYALLKDYLVERLTGQLVSEDSLLCSTILWDINTREYWPGMLDYLGINEIQLPAIARQGEIVGTVTAEAATELGLPAGLPVSVGGLDQACGALGIGNASPGIFSESTGSALASVTIVEGLSLDPEGRVPCFPAAVPGQYMLHNFSTGGMVMRWYRDEFCPAERQIEEIAGVNAYYLIDQEVLQVEPGADGLLMLPHLQGSGPPDLDPYARGAIVGITLAHKKQHVSRAVMEGIAMVLRRMIESTTVLGVHVDEIISLSGGSKSDAWCQIKADATQTTVRTLQDAESAACRGAAIIAGVNVGLWDSIHEVAGRGVEFARTFTPNPAYAETYDRLFERYVAVQAALAPLYRSVDDSTLATA
ncbi:FGGY-family carbohydrate kinase [Paenarthrobacter sp. NPDC090520]|uniref:xylulokinase n=1 Tax=Paenarthrobacter sp. NPDC090520 TaxID=3364382 RepID=UPI003817C66E